MSFSPGGGAVISFSVDGADAAQRQIQNVGQALVNANTRAGTSAAQTANAMRMVPAQLTDIVVGLQGGQAPLTVFLQQGGQLRDMFGSAGAAARGVASSLLGLVNPFTVGAAVVAGLGYAYHVGSAESAAFSRAILTSGNAAGTTVDQLSRLSQEIGAISGARGDASEALTLLVQSAQVPAENLGKYALAAVDAQRVLGRSIGDTVNEFSKLGRAPLSALQAIDGEYHNITAATFAQVKALQDEGRMADAANVAQQAYANGITSQRDKVLESLGSWQKAWMGLKMYASDAANWVVDIAGGRSATDFDKINTLLKARTDLQENMRRAQVQGNVAVVAEYQAELDANKRSIDTIRDKAKAKTDAAAADAKAQKADDAQKQWLMDSDKYLTRQAQLQRELTKARNEGATAFANDDPAVREQKINDRLAAIRKSYSDIYNAGIDSNIEAMRRRDQVADVLEQRDLARIAAARAAGSMDEDSSIQATAAAELAAFNRKAALMAAELAQTKRKANSEKEQADITGQIDVLNEQRKNRELQLTNDLFAAEQRRYRLAVSNSADVIEKEMAERNSLVQQVQAQQDYNEQIGLSEKQVAALTAARLRDTAARKDADADTAEGLDLTGERAARIREEAAALRDRAAAIIEGADKAEQANLWKQAVDQYDQVFQQGFAGMLNDGKAGWSSFTKSLVTTFRTSVADQLYKMFARPFVVQMVGSLMGVSPTAIAGQVAGTPNAYGVPGASAGGVGSAISLAQTASTLYKAVTGGFESLGTTVADAVQAGMYQTGMTTQIASNGAFATGAGAVASYGAGILGGHVIGNAIAGDYSVNHGQAVTNIASVIGAVVGGPIGGAIGGAIGGLINRAFGMGSKETTSQGMRGTLTANSLAGTSYLDWHQDGGWFRADKNDEDKTPFTAQTTAQFTQGLSAIETTSASFAKSMGVSADWLSSYSKTFDVKLTGDATKDQQTVTDFFSGIGDEIAERLVPGLDQFSKSGETASATLQRLAGDFQTTDQVAQLIGKTSTQAFGSIGIASAQAREQLVNFAGGASTLAQEAQTYAQNFLTEGQRLLPVQQALDAAMASLGLSSVQTREQFKDVVDSLDLTTAAGGQEFTALMALSDAFAQVHQASTSLAKSQADIASEQKDLQDQYDQLTLTQAQLATKARDAISPLNLALYDNVQAATAAKNAIDATKTSLSSIATQMQGFSTTAAGLNNSLLLSDLTTLTPKQQLEEARKQLQQTVQAAQGGDATAQGQLSSVEQTFLKLSQQVNGADAQYSTDLAMVMKTNDGVADWAKGQASIAQQQLDVLNSINSTASGIYQQIGKQVSGTTGGMIRPGVGEPVTGVRATGAAQFRPTAAVPIDYSSKGTANTEALVAEIKLLRTEVAGLRAEQRQQTGDIIGSNASAVFDAADKMVVGVHDAVTDGAYAASASKRRLK
jgi:phage-related minor tail protein